MKKIYAILMVAVGLVIFIAGLNWQLWCPNCELGACLVFTMDIFGGFLAVLGVYFLFPKLFKKFEEDDDEEDDDEEDDDEEDADEDSYDGHAYGEGFIISIVKKINPNLGELLELSDEYEYDEY